MIKPDKHGQRAWWIAYMSGMVSGMMEGKMLTPDSPFLKGILKGFDECETTVPELMELKKEIEKYIQQ